MFAELHSRYLDWTLADLESVCEGPPGACGVAQTMNWTLADLERGIFYYIQDFADCIASKLDSADLE